jgi:hypothetical protein
VLSLINPDMRSSHERDRLDRDQPAKVGKVNVDNEECISGVRITIRTGTTACELITRLHLDIEEARCVNAAIQQAIDKAGKTSDEYVASFA